jgi:ribosome-associated protein
VKSREKALFIADLAGAKLAEDTVILDMRKISNITDFFIIVSASSTKRAQTIADNIEEGLKKKKDRLSGIEGYAEADWIVLDAFDVVVHVFTAEVRKFYNLENLWSDAPKIKICQKGKKKKKTRLKKISKTK